MAEFTGKPSRSDTFVGADNVTDTFTFAVTDLTGADTVTGGGGSNVDVLRFSTAGTIAASAFAKVSGIEQIVLANGTNSLTLTNALVGSARGDLLAVTGGSGNDTVDATAVTTAAHRLSITAGSGSDTLKGGAGADTFTFTTIGLTGADTVTGGGGSSRDMLRFSTAGTITASDVAKVSGIEQILLANGTNSLTLTNALVGSASGDPLAIAGGAGNDTVDATAVTTAANRVSITAGTGSDTLKGGAGADTFGIKAADLSNADTISGGGGTDTLAFSTAGTIASASFAKVSGIEAIRLAAGTNSLTLTNALVGSASGDLLVVTGGSGNDRIDGSAVTTVANRLDIAAGTGNDTLIGGAGKDIFRFAVAALGTDDTVTGGGDSDTLIFSTAGTVTAASLGKVSGIEQIRLANGTNAITLTTALAASATGDLAVIGGTGNDTIDGAALTGFASGLEITLGTGNDTARGGTAADSFILAASALTNADTISGNGGFDRLVFSAAGTVMAASLGKVSGIEQIILADGTNAIALTNAMVASASSTRLAVIGGTGSDTIDGSAVTSAANQLDIAAGTGADTLKGGAGNDRFVIAASALTSADTIVGNIGTDDLLFSAAGTVTATSLGKVSGIEQIILADGTNAITLTNAMVSSALNTQLTVLGGAGNDTIDGSAVTSGANQLFFVAGTGADTLKGGSGSDRFIIAASALTNADTIAGNAGRDEILFATAGTVTAASLGKVSGIEQIRLADGTNAVTLTNAMVASALDTRLAVIGGTGNDTIDGSGVTSAADQIDFTAGTGADTLKGGAGNDRFIIAASALTSADTVAGNKGSDELVFSAAGTVTAASLGKVSGIEQISLADGTNVVTLTNAMVSSALNTRLTVLGGAGNDTIDGSGVTSAANLLDFTAGTGTDTLKGGAGNDRFIFAASALTSADTIAGSTGRDEILFATAGTVTAASLGKVSGIEQIRLADGTNAVTLANAMVASALDTRLTVIGGTGNDTIDGSGVTSATNELDITAGTGTDTLKGGAGNDRFTVAASALTGADTIFGNKGSDELIFSTAGTVTAASLGKVSGIERLVLADGINAITLTDAIVTSATGKQIAIFGGDGADTIGLGSVKTGGKVTLDTAAGADLVTLGAHAVTLAGTLGSGADALVVSTGGPQGVLDGGGDVDTLIVTGAGNFTFDVTLSDDQTVGDTAVFTGFESIDGSAMTGDLTATSTSGGYLLIGGSGNDTLLTNYAFSFANGATLLGGGGDDGIEYNYASARAAGIPLLDGEGGSDTLLGVDHGDALVIDLRIANADQTKGDLSDVRNFENVDWTGNGGSLTATVSAGANRIFGGNGSDTLVLVGAADLTIDLRHEGDQTAGDEDDIRKFENIDGRTYSGVLTVTADATGNRLLGGKQGDQLNGNGGTDFIDGGSGDDTIENNFATFDADGATFLGKAGNDRIEYATAGGAATEAQFTLLDGGADVDTLFARFAPGPVTVDLSIVNGDQISDDRANVRNFENVDWSAVDEALTATGGAGANSLTGGGGIDTLNGGGGSDELVGRGGADRLFGGTGDDTVILFGGDFVLGELVNGGDDTDTLVVFTSDTTSFRLGTVVGFEELQIVGAGANIIMTANQADQFTGFTQFPGGGGDVSESFDIVFDAPGSLNMNDGVSYSGFDASDRVFVTGSSGADTFVGGALTDIIDGGNGDDVITSTPTNFFLFADNERVQGGAGNDRIELNFGSDAARQPIFDGGADQDTLFSTRDSLVFDARVATGADQAALADNVTLLNFENADWTGNDRTLQAFGGNGSNVFTGGNDIDRLDGGGGADTLAGNGGEDLLTGGAGNDTFVYRARNEGGTFGDIITDFGHSSGNDDRFQFDFFTFAFNTDVSGFTIGIDAAADTNINDVDLVRFTAGTLSSAPSVNSFLFENNTGDEDEGIFVVAKDADNHTLLYYSAHASGAEVNAELIADLGTGVALADIQVSDFVFV